MWPNVLNYNITLYSEIALRGDMESICTQVLVLYFGIFRFDVTFHLFLPPYIYLTPVLIWYFGIRDPEYCGLLDLLRLELCQVSGRSWRWSYKISWNKTRRGNQELILVFQSFIADRNRYIFGTFRVPECNNPKGRFWFDTSWTFCCCSTLSVGYLWLALEASALHRAVLGLQSGNSLSIFDPQMDERVYENHELFKFLSLTLFWFL